MAINIHQMMLTLRYRQESTLLPWPKMPPMIALAVGKKAVVYDLEGGTRCNEEQLKHFFQDDLSLNVGFPTDIDMV